MPNAPDISAELLDRSRRGEPGALDEIFSRFRPRLRRMVTMRLDEQLQGRIDASDVIQDAFVEAVEKLDGYLREPKIPVFLWLRLIVGERLLKLHRYHLGTQRRDAAREVSLSPRGCPDASSLMIAGQLLDREKSPSDAALKTERAKRLRSAIQAMDPMDREVLSLRHFEELQNSEVALELQIGEEAAAKRYIRAMKRLKQILADLTADTQGL